VTGDDGAGLFSIPVVLDDLKQKKWTIFTQSRPTNFVQRLAALALV